MITLEDVKRLRLEAGDALVLRVPAELSSRQINEVQDELRHVFPGHRTLILAGDVELEVVADVELSTSRGTVTP